jgi:FkbM family methyltransferase
MRLMKAFKHLAKIPEIFVCYFTCVNATSLVLGYLRLKKLSYPFVFETRKGQKILLNTFHDLVTVWVVFIRQEYRVDSNCKFILDAGANIGSFSIFASMQAPHSKIIAFEPFPKTFELLQNNIKLNHLENRVKIIPVALGPKDGDVYMDSNPDLPSQSNGTVESGLKDGIRVPIKSLKTIYATEQITHIDYFKMDIEGGEHPLISQASSEEFAPVQKFSLEYHPDGSFEKIETKLKSFGMKKVKDFQFHQDSGVAWFERSH